MTPETLKQVLPYSGDQADTFAGPLTDAMLSYNINTSLRIAQFLANVATETESLHLMLERGSGENYQGRMGNTEPGDGPRFKGRGCLQITGRANYAACGEALGLDLLNHPELLEMPKFAALSAAWYWQAHGCNILADKFEFGSIVLAINGGYTDLNERIQCLWTAGKVLGI